MKDFIRDKLRFIFEDISLPKIDLKSNGNVTDDDKLLLQKIDWKDIDFDAKPSGNLVSLTFKLPEGYPDISNITMYLKKLPSGLFSVHDIKLADNQKGLGLGYKIYKSIIMNAGNLHSGKKMRMNTTEIPKIWNKLAKDPDIICDEDENSIYCTPRN